MLVAHLEATLTRIRCKPLKRNWGMLASVRGWYTEDEPEGSQSAAVDLFFDGDGGAHLNRPRLGPVAEGELRSVLTP